MASYFKSCIPSDVLSDHLIDFVSDRPRHLFPHGFVDAKDVYNLLQVPSLRDTVLWKFPTLSTKTTNSDTSGASFDPATEDPGLIVDDATLLEVLIPQLCENLRNICIGSVMEFGCQWLNAYSFQNLEQLELYDIEEFFPLDDLLCKCPSLKRLSLIGEPLHPQHFQAIMDRSPNIRALSVHGVRITTKLDLFWPSLTNLEELSIHLEDVVCVTGAQDEDTIYEKISSSCPLLHTLDLGVVQYHRLSCIMGLVLRIGNALQNLELEVDGIPANILATRLYQIRTTCREVKVRLTSRAEAFVPSLLALGPAADALQPTGSMFIQSPQGLRDAASMCPNLKSLTLVICETWAPDFLDSMLGGGTGKRLVELRLNIYNVYADPEFEHEVSPAVTCVARHTGNLIRLVMDRVRPNVSLRPIAEANRDMRGVVLLVDSSVYPLIENQPKVAENWLFSVVDDFVTCCEELEDLVVSELETFETIIPSDNRITKLDDLCVQPRARRVPIRVGRFYYER